MNKKVSFSKSLKDFPELREINMLSEYWAYWTGQFGPISTCQLQDRQLHSDSIARETESRVM